MQICAGAGAGDKRASPSILRPYWPPGYSTRQDSAALCQLFFGAIGVSMNQGQTISAPALGVAFLMT
jgi:hypothetical protein